MAKDPAFLMYYKDILTSCASWDADELGWYLRLLCHQADKPRGLDPDIESLASLANVKFSQYERFKKCWEARLKGKFEATLDGLLINLVQHEIMERRREYSENQRVSGVIGYLIKLVKNHFDLSKQQVAALASSLEDADIVSKTREGRIGCLQDTLQAILGNVIANEIINKIKTENGNPQPSRNSRTPRKTVLAQGLAEQFNPDGDREVDSESEAFGETLVEPQKKRKD